MPLNAISMAEWTDKVQWYVNRLHMLSDEHKIVLIKLSYLNVSSL